MSEFYYPLECGWDIVPGASALVSNTPPQAGRVLRTTRVLYRYSAFVGGSMHPYAHDTGKTLAGKRYVMRPRYGPIPANSICCVFVFVVSGVRLIKVERVFRGPPEGYGHSPHHYYIFGKTMGVIRP